MQIFLSGFILDPMVRLVLFLKKCGSLFDTSHCYSIKDECQSSLMKEAILTLLKGEIRWMQKDTTASDVTWYFAFLSLRFGCAKSLFYTDLSQPGSKLRRHRATTNVWFSNVGNPEIFPFFLNFQNGLDDGQCRQSRWSSSLHSQRRPCKRYCS